MKIGISTRALFDLEASNTLFEREGPAAYDQYQVEHEHEPLKPGTAYRLVRGLLSLNQALPEGERVEVVIMSRNSADVSIRVFESCKALGLDIRSGAFTSGRPLSDYLGAFAIDLFLSRNHGDVQAARDADVPSAIVLDTQAAPRGHADGVRIAFDADCVLVSEESERIYKSLGLEAFELHERDQARQPMPAGPHARLLRTLSKLQQQLGPRSSLVRIAIVTARGAPAHERLVRTLRAWNVHVDEAFFMSGAPKDRVLAAFGADMFFDDQDKHLQPASALVPSSRVPYETGSPLRVIK